MSLRILKVWSTFQTEIKYHDHYLALEMENSGHKTLFLASDKVEPVWQPFLKQTKFDTEKNDTWSNSKIIRFKSFSFANKPFITQPIRFFKAIKNFDPDVIHLLGIAYPVNQLALIFSWFFPKAAVFVNDHGLISEEKSGWKAKLFYFNSKLIFEIFGRKKIKKFIVPNIASKEFVMKRYNLPESKVSIIPLGYDDKIFFRQPELKNKLSEKLVIGFAGKIDKFKNIPLLLDSIAQSVHREKIVCYIAGLNEKNIELTNEIKSLASKHKLDVNFSPLLSSEKLAKFYNEIDVAIFPGAISITTIEANGCGTPVILSNSINGLENRVEDGKGILFHTQNELIMAIDNYFCLKQKREIDNQKIEVATKKYAWKKISGDYLNEYFKQIQAAEKR